MRMVLGLEYDGSQYHGWQIQPDLRTVQQVVEQAISHIADAPITVTCAGRTDTGVHATHQIVHFDTEVTRNLRAWTFGVNAFLPKDVCVRFAQEVSEDFHARFSALSRRYRYIIYNAPIRPAILQSHVAWQYHSLDHEAMHRAGQCLLGENDFTSFRAIDCQSKTPMRYLHSLEVRREGDLVILDVTANAFLHHMVRNIAGVLIAVGLGKKPVAWVQEVLKACDRRLGAETASPYGLYLVDVAYPKSFGILETRTGPWFLGKK